MLTEVVRRWMALAVLCSVVAACDQKSGPKHTAQADAPAVVKLPPPLLPSDTARPDTIEAHNQKMREAGATLERNYAVLGAAMVFGDRRMVASMYAPSATLETPDSTYRGSTAIAYALTALGPPKSLRAFNRRSLALRVVDSTVIDSGMYAAVSVRQGADSTVERGSYMAQWRIHPAPMEWMLSSDRLFRAAKKPKGR